MELYDIRVTVERIEGRSVCGLAVGDYFEVTESSRLCIPPGRHFCLYALSAVLPLLPAKQRRLADDDWLEQESLVCCPDPEERLVMRIERLAPLAFQGDNSAEEHAALARLAEGLGFDTLSVYGDLLYQPPLYPLLVMALATRCVDAAAIGRGIYTALMVGTWSRGAARIAARLADEVKVGGSANPAMVRRMRRWLAEDLPRYRRGEDEVGVVVGAVTVADRDGAAARCRARREVAMYLEVVGTLDPTARLPAGLLPGLRQLLRAGKVEAAGRLVPDDILDLFAFAGTPEQICRQVEVLAEAGVRRIEFGTPHGAPAEAGIRLLAAQVLPHFR